MPANKRIRKEHIGRSVDFLGFDDNVYCGTLSTVSRRGIVVRYYVPQIYGEVSAYLSWDVAGRVQVL